MELGWIVPIHQALPTSTMELGWIVPIHQALPTSTMATPSSWGRSLVFRVSRFSPVGSFDELRVYGRVLSIQEILALAVEPSLTFDSSDTGGSPPPAPGTELVVNGGFEQPDIPRVSFRILGSLPGWTLSPGSRGTGIEIQDNRAGAPQFGDQFVELDSNGPSTQST